MKYLIGYRDGPDHKVRFYLGVNGAKGRAECGPKKLAPRFDKDMAKTILRQLPSVDNRDWQMAEDADRCKFL